ncbi:hypothetical protein B0H65DRAFT_273735 [Neurospora tetraspora]|uniref:Secreted protein n=1 Tax=Neurospora tetraspora TaxID=94610 RepID=A0AAE0JBC5_9PEZI|nr:hypothetical protein B0H65DRAFT_273735 [Neurospora tetraspora]
MINFILCLCVINLSMLPYLSTLSCAAKTMIWEPIPDCEILPRKPTRCQSKNQASQPTKAYLLLPVCSFPNTE